MCAPSFARAVGILIIISNYNRAHWGEAQLAPRYQSPPWTGCVTEECKKNGHQAKRNGHQAEANDHQQPP